MAIELLRAKAAFPRTGDSRSGGYDKIRRGLLPPSVPIGPRARAFVAHELDAVNAARIAGKSDDQIRSLVREIVAARGSSAQQSETHEANAVKATHGANAAKAGGRRVARQPARALE